jgi:type II secretory pathway pseudopilin PulG
MGHELMKTTSIRRPVMPSEEGYILVAVIFMLTILIISLAVAAPKVARDIQRDRELETMHRGKQYIRAIRMYYKKNNAYPPNIDALLKPSNALNIRYLRKKYVDPTTGKEEWKAIHFGQNKAPTAMGFFGQPLGGSTLAGIGPGAAGNVAGASAPGSSFMGGNSATAGNSGTGLGASTGSDGTGTGSSSTVAGTAGSTGTGGTSGTDPTFGTGGQTFGGLGIIGFSPNSAKASILTYKTKNHYNEWEFVYDPIVEQMMMGGMSGAGSGGVPAGSIGNTPGSSQNGVFGTNGVGNGAFGTSGTGNNSGTGASPTPTQPAPQLQQQ